MEKCLRVANFQGEINFADCAAKLVALDMAMEQPFRIVFSGPAAGAVSSAHFGQLIGDDKLMCCDIGGTSCDISVVTNGQPYVNTTFELEHDMLVNALSIAIDSIGAGGGSIISINPSGEMRVGPESAGGVPGPASYGKGGTAPTLTDTCLLMGLLDPERFLAGSMRLDPELARAAFERLDTPLSFEQRVAYAYKIGLNNIAEGLIDVAIKQGIDPREYSLIAYGAAGPLLLPAVLSMVNARRVIVPPYPGLFSALGLLSSDLVYSDNRSAYMLLVPGVADTISQIYRTMEEKLLSHVSSEKQNVVIRRTFDGRLYGQTWETPFIEVPPGEITEETISTLIKNFHDVYEQRTGNRFEMIPVQSVTYRLEVIVPTGKVSYPHLPAGQPRTLQPDGAIFLYYESVSALALAVFRALKDALGPDAVGGDYCSLSGHAGNGVFNGFPWTSIGQTGGEHGPWAATKDGDGDSYMVNYLTNNLDPATEAIEAEAPCVVLRKEYTGESGGAGKHRGGAAVMKDTLWLGEGDHYSMALHCKSPSGFGVYGGKSGATGAVWFWEPDAYGASNENGYIGTDGGAYARSNPVAGVLNPETKALDPNGKYFYLASVPVWHTRPNAMFRYITNGGGGWGNPLERDPERVKRDVRDEYVSMEGARTLYGVVIKGDPVHDPEGLEIDLDATRQLREEMSRR